jgi:thymidylate kinase
MRDILLDTANNIDQDAIPFLFISDMLHVAKSIIIPELARGNIVITDRYIPSTWVYQIETAEHLSAKQKSILESVLHTWIPKPDITFILDVTEDDACDRLNARNIVFGLEYGKSDRYEYVDPVEISRRRMAYLTFANSEFGKHYNVEYRSTSGTDTTPEKVASSIIATLKNKFN